MAGAICRSHDGVDHGLAMLASHSPWMRSGSRGVALAKTTFGTLGMVAAGSGSDEDSFYRRLEDIFQFLT